MMMETLNDMNFILSFLSIIAALSVKKKVRFCPQKGINQDQDKL